MIIDKQQINPPPPVLQVGAKLLEDVAEHLPGVKDIRVMEDSDFKLVARY